MSDKSAFGGFNSNENENENENEPLSEEEGFKLVESVFKAEINRTEGSEVDENKEFISILKHLKRAKELGFLDSSSTTIYQGGIHIKDSSVENHGNFVGNDQTLHSNINDQRDFEGISNTSLGAKEKVGSVVALFDQYESIKQRSFMIALAALNGCNYRIVVEASQRLQVLLQPQAEVDTEV